MSRWPCKDYLGGTCNNSFCEKWHPPECLFYKTKSGCRFGEKCSFAHRQVDEQPTKRSKTNDDKSAVAMLKKGNWQERESVSDGCHDRPGKPGKRGDDKLEQNSSKRQFSDARQLGCVFQDMKPPKSILRKGTDMPRPIQRAKFTKAVARHTKIRDQNPSLGYICPGEPHERSPNAPKFEDRSQEETEWQEQRAREAACKLAKSALKLKEHQRTTFFSPSENRCLPASTLKPEEREFVVDSGASMHLISKKDLSDAEMDTLTKSCSPTIVITANGEVQTQEEAIVYVKELDIFLTMKVLENTPAVLSLGKLCDENGYSYEWINGDVTRTTHTNLDVKQEKRIDDYWNIDGSRNLSDPWTGFTQFTLLDEKAPDGHMWSGRRLTRQQLTSRPDHLWPELWKSMGKHGKLKEKQKWSEESST